MREAIDVTRLATNRDTHLTREEIAAEALRCFDQSATAPSIRHLASVLRVTPSAIYHHFPSRAAIVQAAVDLVWDQAELLFRQVIPDPWDTDPTEVLVTAGVVTRQAFSAHYQVAPFIAATRQAHGPLADIMLIMTSAFERMGLDENDAAEAFHTYASYTVGAVLFAATRRITNEQLLVDSPAGLVAERQLARQVAGNGKPAPDDASTGFGHAIEAIIDVSIVDPDRDEQLFADGLRRLVTTALPSGGHALSR
jgi:AcrR family transcriptional regulator